MDSRGESARPMEGSASVNLSPSTTRSTPEAPGSSHFSDAHSRFDVAQDISFSRFQQSLLGVVHDKDTVERRARDLEARLQGQVAATKGAQADASELQSRLDDASRAQEEAELRAAAQRKVQEDERARHTLHARAASEKASQQQQKLHQQGQQLYQLEEQLRARTTEASRLRIEKEGADALIASFQAKLEEVGKVIEATTTAEVECRKAVESVRSDQAELQTRLGDAQRTQRDAAPRVQLERRLKDALREREQAREREHELTAALRFREDEREATRARYERMTQRLEAAQRELASAHSAELAFDGERRSLCDQLAHAQSSSLREREKNELLMRKLAATDACMKVLHREVQHADANAHEAVLSAQLKVRTVAEQHRLAEVRAAAKEALERDRAHELEQARAEARQYAAEGVALKEEIKSLKHGLKRAPSPNGQQPADARPPQPPLPVRSAPAPAPPARTALAPHPCEDEQPPAESIAPALLGGDTATPIPAARASSPLVTLESTHSAGRAHADDLSAIPPGTVERSSSLLACPPGWASAAPSVHSYFPPPPPSMPPAPPTAAMLPHAPPQTASGSLMPPPPPAPPAEQPPMQAVGMPPPTERPPGSGDESMTCAVCDQTLYGAHAACGKCGKACHAACAQRSAQDAHKAFTCMEA